MVQVRRRHHHFRCRWPLAAAPAALLVVLLIVVISFLSLSPPPILDDRPLQERRALRRAPSFSSDRVPANSRGDWMTKSVETNDIFDILSRTVITRDDIWTSKLAKNYYGCSNSSEKFSAAEFVMQPNRYLMIVTSGGLNQQRTGIIDSVVAARILNATLVLPKLDRASYWRDGSNFSEIFDADWFISYLSKDVKIVKDIPRKELKGIRSPYTMRVRRKCSQRCYQNRVLPALLKKHVVQLTKFDYRLANKLDTDLQKLRCRVNYHALRYTAPILEMGEKLVWRMREKSKYFIALHLRFEPDMLAFSGCYYGGGDKERAELGSIRKRWKNLHTSNPDKERRHGKCPLTPEEVGLMLRALGFGSDAHIYVASGDIYGGENTLAPLKALFPNYHTKETLASEQELVPFSSFSSRMAALDFIVCDESDAFVTNNNGNMAKMIAGRRRYFGHKRTIRPNAKKLYSLFLKKGNVTWEEFASKVHTFQKGFMGEPKEIRPGRGEFHENPSVCICDVDEAKRVSSWASLSSNNDGKESTRSNSLHGPIFPVYMDEENDGFDGDDQDENHAANDAGSNDIDYDSFDDPPSEEILSD